MEYDKMVTDKTFNIMYQISITVISLIAFLNILETILLRKQKQDYNLKIDKFVIFLDVVLIILSTLTLLYYFRKRSSFRYIEDVPFKVSMLTVNGFVIGIMGLIAVGAN